MKDPEAQKYIRYISLKKPTPAEKKLRKKLTKEVETAINAKRATTAKTKGKTRSNQVKKDAVLNEIAIIIRNFLSKASIARYHATGRATRYYSRDKNKRGRYKRNPYNLKAHEQQWRERLILAQIDMESAELGSPEWNTLSKKVRQIYSEKPTKVGLKAKQKQDGYTIQANKYGMSETSLEIIDTLAKLGYIKHIKGQSYSKGSDPSRSSTIEPTQKFFTAFLNAGGASIDQYEGEDFDVDEGVERLFYKSEGGRHVEREFIDVSRKQAKSLYNDLVKYTEFTKKFPYRVNFKAVKASDTRKEEIKKVAGRISKEHTNPIRIFNSRDLNEGGRFYEGWWYSMPKEGRKAIQVEIKGHWEDTVELDFKSLHPSILFTKVGQGSLVNKADLYEVINPKDNNPYPRSLIKMVFMFMAYSKKSNALREQVLEEIEKRLGIPFVKSACKQHRKRKMTILERQVATLVKEDMELIEEQQLKGIYQSFKDKQKWQTFKGQLKDKYGLIWKELGKGLWKELQNFDSIVANKVHSACLREGIPVLSIHDSFIVPQSKEREARKIIQHAYKSAFREKYNKRIKSDYVPDVTKK
ncbi:MAG: hypothetical protein GC136_07605 [Alphaproteobacteria bacterium]|nr:hypothetical protein [Alphaproteobacteria bacterium]